MKYKYINEYVNSMNVLKFISLILAFLILSCLPVSLEIDKNLVSGQLENGLRYYIYGNQVPSKAVYMGILFNVGSLNEEENERGLAHYLEHMAFKGTKDYPGGENILEVLKKFGMEFGADINAYTSFDKTYYRLDLPDGGNESEIDEALNLLKNWAFQIEFDEVAIDRERNIILEEKKLRENYLGRLREKMFRIVLKNSKYEVRSPIGLEERILSFKSADFKKFYKKWYRPDLTSVIIVGDIDPYKIEKKVKERFSSFAKPVGDPEKIKINLNTVIDEEFVSIEDFETPFPSMSFVVKKEIEEKYNFATISEVKRLVEETLLDDLFINRFYELKTSGTNYFMSFNKSNSHFASDDNNYILLNEISFNINPKHFKEAVEGFFYEIERIKRFGFTKGEVDKIKSKLISYYRLSKDNINKRHSSSIVDILVDVASGGSQMFDMNEYFDIAIDHLNKISLRAISDLARSEASLNNMSIIYFYSKKSHPNLTLEEVKELRNLALDKEIKPYNDILIQGEFFEKSLESKNIVDEKELSDGISYFMLENGVEVYFKNNERQKNVVNFRASSWGGLLSENAELVPVLSLAPRVVSNSGYGDYSKLQVDKYLSDKVVSLIPTVGDQMSSIGGSADVKDLETLFKLIYFTFNEPKIDDVILQSMIEDVKAVIKSRQNDSKHLFYSAINRFYNNDDYRLRDIEYSDLKNVSKELLLDFYKKRFTYANNFKFIFVGDVNLETIKSLSGKYLGNLSSKNLDEFRDLDYSYKRNIDRIIIRKGEDSSSTVCILYPFKFNYTPENVLNYEALASLLTEGLVKTIRRKLSSVYSIGAAFDCLLRKHSDSDGFISISFMVEPKVLDNVLMAVHEYILEKQKIGVVDEDFDYIKRNIIKNNNIGSESNGYWLSKILSSVLWYDAFKDTFSVKFIENSLKKDIINTLFKGINFGQKTEIVLIPEKSS
ncbi:insulinase family protein [Borrelia anserina]|uniref:Peptidase, M16 family protein n=2 Tax=Borrelia anserina TaxID=143 RepID=W5SU05_BORAN|nr:insulinase family protein [Borrelia anserina]AHH08511.1 Peptidase, M16 family protein [Borrelia anserina BA2]APR64981.1 peptidase M16 [Borrelia anserina Es]UPA06904.1 insulinase family protein [Borrelia anserina]